MTVLGSYPPARQIVVRFLVSSFKNSACHFSLMPRICMALAEEDRHPVTDIMRQTPEIPDGAQRAIFLRNVTPMVVYAADPRARIKLGIFRRLTPLLGNDRRKIELLNSLLSRRALIGQRGVLMIQSLDVIRRPYHVRQISFGGQCRAA